MVNTIVVAGAGVSGLTTAMLLSRSQDNVVTVVAKHMPGDYDIEYASPFAGANVLPMSTVENSIWEKRTWPELKRLTKEVPEAGIHLQKVRVFRRDKDLDPTTATLPMDPLFLKDPWYSSLIDDYRELNSDEVKCGFDSGCEFGSLCINVAVYLPWLVGQCLKNGVVIKRAVLSHLSEAKNLSHTGKPADIIINATSLGSKKLGGVLDDTLTPARGQTVLIRNECSPMLVTSGTDDAPEDMVYVMTRAAGGGTIIGGTYDIGNWESIPDPNIASRIMQRVVELHPEIAGGKGVKGLSVIRHAVGLRPYRPGGVRIEADKLEDGTPVVHNYGHAGWGYQGSYGCSEKVIELVNEIRKARGDNVDAEPPLFVWDAKQ